jgi:hypothetical protein
MIPARCKHMVTGYDHILFLILAGLLLAAWQIKGYLTL